jgi:hypothetical protein
VLNKLKNGHIPLSECANDVISGVGLVSKDENFRPLICAFRSGPDLHLSVKLPPESPVIKLK